jgi:hypothetical protein
VPIACIQILNSVGNTIVQQWYFGNSANNQLWETGAVQYNHGSIGTGLNITPDTAATYSYASVYTGNAVNRFTQATSTPSSGTGAVDGIAEPSTPMTLGEKTMPQLFNTYYLFRETSGSTVGYTAYCRSPFRTWTSGERIRIAYIIGNYSSGYTPTDALFFGIA